MIKFLYLNINLIQTCVKQLCKNVVIHTCAEIVRLGDARSQGEARYRNIWVHTGTAYLQRPPIVIYIVVSLIHYQSDINQVH